MNPSIQEPLPPDMLQADRLQLASALAQAGPGDVPMALLQPLVARATGDAVFPQLAAHDAHAARLLARLGVDAAGLRVGRSALYGELARTRILRNRAAAFLDRHPRALGVSLGAGLSHVFQWLDRGANTWVDADRPEVHTLRQRLLPPHPGGRRLNAACDLSVAGWWQRLGLPSGTYELPLVVLFDGVALDLAAAQTLAVLREIGEQAPPGTRLLIDAPGRWAVRHTRGRTPGPLHGRPLTPQALAAAHPRLRVDAVHPVMTGCGLRFRLAEPLHKIVFGLPLHAVLELGVDA